MLIYLDMCAIQRPLDDDAQLRVRLEAEAIVAILTFCQGGGAGLASSDALLHETSRNPNDTSRIHAEVILAKAIARQPLTPAVEARADELTASGMRPLDAMHVASAEAVGADYLCTCDDRLLRRARAAAAPPLRVLSPLELATELNL